MDDRGLPLLRAELLAWYDRHRRELPWRGPDGAPPDPYRVWLSEIMLQQTRVETVRGYFERWLERFPTVESLADAELDEVMKSWEGLGYYSRARNFHRAVREVVSRYDGRVPDDPGAFRELPGVGRYTAGAVMSIAFGHEEPVVDGNVRRVLARLLDDPSPTEQRLWQIAGRLAKGPRPGDLNQALMELGAMVCTPRSPRCERCPVADRCAARTAGTQGERPARRRRGPLPHEHRVAAVIDEAGLVLVGRRREEERLGGMWEFPGGLMNEGEPPGEALRRVLLACLGIHAEAGERLPVVAHAFTHVRVTYHPLRARLAAGTPRVGAYTELRWVSADGLRGLALPRAQQRIAARAILPGHAATGGVHG